MTLIVIIVAYVLAGLAFTYLKGIYSRRIEERVRWPHVKALAKRWKVSPLKAAKICRRMVAVTEMSAWPIFLFLLTLQVIERNDDK